MVNILDIIKDKLYNNIYRVDVFEKEYKKMFGKSKSLYFREHEQLAINLHILDTEMNAALERDQFHAVIGHSPLYSIRHISQSNPRVLFIFTESDGAVVLLSCTLEKSKSDYDAAIARAEERLNLLEED